MKWKCKIFIYYKIIYIYEKKTRLTGIKKIKKTKEKLKKTKKKNKKTKSKLERG